MLINDNKPVEPVEKERPNVAWLNILLRMRHFSRSDARVRIEEQVALVMDFREVPIAACQRDRMAKDPISRNPQEIGEERIVGVAPGPKVAGHWIDSEVVKELPSLKKLE